MKLRLFTIILKNIQQRLAMRVLLAALAGKWPSDHERTRWRDYISDLGAVLVWSQVAKNFMKLIQFHLV